MIGGATGMVGDPSGKSQERNLLDKETIEQAKLYAKEQNLSLSKLVEAYLQALTQKRSEGEAVSPLVAQLTGLIPSDYNEKANYRAHQLQKHS